MPQKLSYKVVKNPAYQTFKSKKGVASVPRKSLFSINENGIPIIYIEDFVENRESLAKAICQFLREL